MIHREAPMFYRLQAVPMRWEKSFFGIKEIDKAIQRAFSHLGRVLQFNCAGSKIAGVRIWWFTVLDSFLMQPVKGLKVHEHLAAYLEIGWIVATLAQAFGDAADSFNIGGHFITLGSIAAGNGLGKVAVLIGEA